MAKTEGKIYSEAEKKRTLNSHTLAIISIIIMFIITAAYLMRISFLVNENVDELLQEVCSQTARTFDESVNAQLVGLRATARALKTMRAATYEDYIGLLARQNTDYKRMGIITPEGKVYSTGIAPRKITDKGARILELTHQNNGPYGLVTSAFTDDDGEAVVLCAVALPADCPASGILYAILPKARFEDGVMGASAHNEYICIASQDGKILNMTAPLAELIAGNESGLKKLSQLIATASRENFAVSQSSGFRIATSQLSFNGWIIAKLTPNSEIWDVGARDAIIGAVISFALLAIAIATFDLLLWHQARGREKRVRAAGIDPMTGMNNHLGFAEASLPLLAHGSLQRYALVFLRTNAQNVYGAQDGYTAGKQALEDMARTISSECESGEICARLEGGQFLMLLRFNDTADMFLRVKALNSHIITKLSMRVQMHYGIYITGDAAVPLNQMIECASEAARRVMRKGDMIGFYDDELHRRQQQDDLLLGRAPAAIKNGEFEVRYKPLRDIDSLDIVGAEATALWHQPDGTALTPDEYVPLLTQNSMMGPLNLFVFERICRDLSAKPESICAGARVLIHMSREIIMDGMFLHSAKNIMKSYGINGSSFEVVFSEALFARAALNNNNFIQQLHESGIRICVDDFDQGSTSLCMFGEMPVDSVRLTSRFIERTSSSDKGIKLIRGLVALVKSLGIDVYAGGAISKAQLELLRESGCIRVQAVGDAALPDAYCALSEIKPLPNADAGFDDWA